MLEHPETTRGLQRKTVWSFNKYLVLIWLIFSLIPVSAKEILLEGKAISESVSIELDFNDSEHVLVGASQYYANFKLSLYDLDSDTLVFSVDAPSDKGFDEVMLVSRSSCTNCSIILSPSTRADTASRYRVWVSTLDEYGTSRYEYQEAVSFFEKYTLAMQFFSEASAATSSFAEELFYKAISTLRELAADESGRGAILSNARLVALSILADAEDHQGREVAFGRALDEILDETRLSPSLIRAYALHDKALLEPDFEDQRMLYDQAIAISHQLQDKRLYAMVANRKAINLTNDGKYEEAIKLLLQARSINAADRRIGSLVRNLGNLSWSNLKAGNLTQAIQFAAEAKLISERYEQNNLLLLSLYYSGIAYKRLGERYISNKYFEEGLKVQSRLVGFEGPSYEGMRGNILEEQARQLIAYEEFDEAWLKATRMKDVFQKLNFNDRVADADSLLSEIAWRSGKHLEAQARLLSLIEYDRENNRTLSLGKNLHKLATMELDQANTLKASSHINSAIDVLIATEDQRALLLSLSTAVNVLHKLKADDEAWILAEKINSVFDLSILPKSDAAEYWFVLSEVAENKNSLEEAIVYLDHAKNNIEEDLRKIRRRDLKRKYLALQKKIYEKSIDLRMSSTINQVNDALLMAESFKARTLEEKLANDISLDKATENQKAQRKEIHRKLLSQALSVHTNSVLDQERALDSAKTLGEALAKLEQDILDERKSAPQISEVSLAEISITPGQQIAFYFTGSINSWLWQISKNGISAHKLPPEKELKEIVQTAVELVSTHPSKRSQNKSTWPRVLSRASEAIIGPISDELNGGAVEQLLIIPDGALFSIPFAALNLDEDRLVVDMVTVSYAPSLGIWALLKENQRRRQGVRKNALVFANAGFDEPSATSLGLLPFSEVEADSIEKIFKDNALVHRGGAANKLELISSLNEAYKIIHLATHGVLDNKEPNLSGLSFPTNSGKTSLWLLPEISFSRVNADLVFLSACETAIGKDVPGEGLMSLSRAFLEAGASNVIGSLWNIEDKATSELVKYFYESHVLHGSSFEVALQNAQTTIMSKHSKKWRDPYYWSGFQLIGAGEDGALR